MTEIRIVTLCCCFTSPEDSAENVQNSPGKLIRKVKKDFPSAVVVKSFLVLDKSKLFPEFKLAILETKKLKCLLVIDAFAPFQRNLKALGFLGKHNIPFKFLELNHLKRGVTLNCLLEYLELTKKIKGEKISNKIKERQESGKGQGLGTMKKKKLMEVISMANYAKRFNALHNPETYHARERIEMLRKIEHLSYRKIADQLKKEKLRTPRGSEFGPKTVERYFHCQQKLFAEGLPSEWREIQEGALMGGTNDQNAIKLKGFKRFQNFHDIMEFQIKEGSKEPFELQIYNNKEETIYAPDQKEITEQLIKKGKKAFTVKLNLKELRVLFPGIYYFKIKIAKKEIVRPFYFYQEALPKSLFTT